MPGTAVLRSRAICPRLRLQVKNIGSCSTLKSSSPTGSGSGSKNKIWKKKKYLAFNKKASINLILSQKRKKSLEKKIYSVSKNLFSFITDYTKICMVPVYNINWTSLNPSVFHLLKKEPDPTQKNRLQLQLKLKTSAPTGSATLANQWCF